MNAPSPIRQILDIARDEFWLADLEVVHRLQADGYTKETAELAIRVLRDVGIVAKGGPIMRRDAYADLERTNPELLDRLDRLVAIGTGAPLA